MKYVCTVCGWTTETDTMPAKCPICGATIFKAIGADGKVYACEHRVGDGKVDDKEVMDGLRANFTGECSEVGMYLAMARVAEREGYPEIADEMASSRIGQAKETGCETLVTPCPFCKLNLENDDIEVLDLTEFLVKYGDVNGEQ